MKVFLTFLSLIMFSLSIKIRIIDDYFVEVYLGEPQSKFKLLIDLTSPFSYIFNSYSNSKTKINENKTQIFSNVYGEFTGKWIIDKIFLTKDKKFNFNLKFLEIISKNTSLNNTDGILGLGYSQEYKESSIYHALNSMKDIFDIKDIMTYDKQNNLIYIGEYTQSYDIYNKDSFILQNYETYPGKYIKLSKIDFKNKTHFEINENAYLGLIPVIITPKNKTEWFFKEYLNDYNKKNGTIYNKAEKGKLFTNIFLNKSSIDIDSSLFFENISFPYKFYIEKNNQAKSTVRIGNTFYNNLDCWYIGLETINIERADFFYENNTVLLYSIKKLKSDLILRIVFFILTSAIFLYIVTKILCSGKENKKENDDEQELKDL